MTISDEELPVLNEIIRSGDKSVIKSTRLNLSDESLSGQIDEDIPQFELPARLKMEVLGLHERANQGDQNHAYTEGLHGTSVNNTELADPPLDDLESKIDRIIDKHIVALRKELRNLLNGTV